MSGGSYNYVCFRIQELEGEISRQDVDPRRASFAKLMGLVGRAMKEIEWVDSCDCSPGDEHPAIDEVFSFLGSDPQTIAKAAAFDSLKKTLAEYLDLKPESDPA
jgi:hypothetical protein